jgi:hypothetical protein
MIANIYRKVAATLCRQLYVGTKDLLESGPSFKRYCQMQDTIVKREIPLSWPDVNQNTLANIAARMPTVNYITGNRAADTNHITRVLLDEIPPVDPRRKKSEESFTAEPDRSQVDKELKSFLRISRS